MTWYADPKPHAHADIIPDRLARLASKCVYLASILAASPSAMIAVGMPATDGWEVRVAIGAVAWVYLGLVGLASYAVAAHGADRQHKNGDRSDRAEALRRGSFVAVWCAVGCRPVDVAVQEAWWLCICSFEGFGELPRAFAAQAVGATIVGMVVVDAAGAMLHSCVRQSQGEVRGRLSQADVVVARHQHLTSSTIAFLCFVVPNCGMIVACVWSQSRRPAHRSDLRAAALFCRGRRNGAHCFSESA